MRCKVPLSDVVTGNGRETNLINISGKGSPKEITQMGQLNFLSKTPECKILWPPEF